MKKPIGYAGFAWDDPKKGYDSDYLKSAEGMAEVEKSKKRNKKHQKFYKEHGFDPTETWNLDSTLTAFILPRLKYFKENLHGHPANLSATEWYEILCKMVAAFEEMQVEAICYDKKNWEKRDKIVQEGLQLFAKHYENLWD